MLDLLLRLPFLPRVDAGAAAATSVAFGHPNFEQYILWDLLIHHDDPVARDLSCTIAVGADVVTIPMGTAVTTNTRVKLSDFLKMPLCVNYTMVVTAVASGMAAGQKIYASGLYYRIRGVPTWSND